MYIPQLQMTSQMARIGIQQHMAQLSIEQPKADLKIEQPRADMKMQSTKGKLTIDQSEAWSDLNLMNTPEWNDKMIAESVQKGKDGVARRAEEGARLIKIEDGENVFVQLAIENGHRHPKTLSIKYVPSVFAVKNHYEPGEVQIDIQANKPHIDVHINKPIVHFTSWKVDIWMEQYPSLEIDIKG